MIGLDPPSAVAILVTAGLCLIAYGCVGRPSLSRPLCVQCGLDLREAIWSDPSRCPRCRASLSAQRAIEAAGRLRQPRWIVFGLLAMSIAAGVLALDRALQRRGLRWRDLQPTAWDLTALARSSGTDNEALAALERRADAGWLDEATARAILSLRESSVIRRVAWTEAAFGAACQTLRYDVVWAEQGPSAASEEGDDDRLSPVVLPRLSVEHTAGDGPPVHAILTRAELREAGRSDQQVTILDATRASFQAAFFPPSARAPRQRGRYELRLTWMLTPERGTVAPWRSLLHAQLRSDASGWGDVPVQFRVTQHEVEIRPGEGGLAIARVDDATVIAVSEEDLTDPGEPGGTQLGTHPDDREGDRQP